MEKLEKFVKGKRVAFVGLAPNILGKELGAEIDSFDIVVRTNHFPIKDEWQKDYGSKCDIIMLHTNLTDKEIEGVKVIMTYWKAPKEKKRSIDYIVITEEERLMVAKRVQKEVSKDPIGGTQGTNMMIFCLEAGALQFKYFGITGYQNLKGQVMDHHEQKHYIHARSDKSMKNNPYHNFQVLNDHLRMYLRQQKVEMDQYSKEYFK